MEFARGVWPAKGVLTACIARTMTFVRLRETSDSRVRCFSQVDLQSAIQIAPSFLPTTTFESSDSKSFWTPQFILEPLRQGLLELFRPLGVPDMSFIKLIIEVDNGIHILRRQIRKRGNVMKTDTRIVDMWQTIRLEMLRGLSERGPDVDGFFRDRLKQETFGELVHSAALKSAFASQLTLPQVHGVLTRSGGRLKVMSWTHLVKSFINTPPDIAQAKTVLGHIYVLACKRIPATSEDQSIQILGVKVDDLDLFREAVDAITMRLMEMQLPVPEQIAYYPICTAVKTASCEGLNRTDPIIKDACNVLETTRDKIVAKGVFTDSFCQAMTKAEKPVRERCECDDSFPNSGELREFFLDYMMMHLDRSVVFAQWQEALRIQETKIVDKHLFPIDDYSLATVLHNAVINLNGTTATRQVAVSVYETMCYYVDYLLETQLVKGLNACSYFGEPPGPLLEVLDDLLSSHRLRIDIARLDYSASQAIAALPKGRIIEIQDKPRSPANGLTVNILRVLDSYIKGLQLSNYTSKERSSYAEVQRKFSSIIFLLVDKVYKQRTKFVNWQEQLVVGLQRIVDQAVKTVLQSLKEATTVKRAKRSLQYMESSIQEQLKHRLTMRGASLGEPGQSPSSVDAQQEFKPAGNLGGTVLLQMGEGPSTSRITSVLKNPPILSFAAVSKPREVNADPKGQEWQGFVEVLASVLLPEIPQTVASLVSPALPSVFYTLAAQMRVKKNVVGSIRHVAETTCVRILDSTILPTLVSTTLLVPETLIRNQLMSIAQNMHFTITPDASIMEYSVRAARQKGSFLGLGVLLQGFVFAVTSELESLMQQREFQDRVVRFIQQRVQQLSRIVIDMFRSHRLADVICSGVELLIDILADVLQERREDVTKVISDIGAVDVIGRVKTFIEAALWKHLKILVDGGSVAALLSDVFLPLGITGIAKDLGSAVWNVLTGRKQT